MYAPYIPWQKTQGREGRRRGRADRQQPHSSSDCPIESPSPGSAGLSWLLSQAEPVLVMSRFDGSARLKMAQLGWLSHFEPSHGNTTVPTHFKTTTVNGCS